MKIFNITYDNYDSSLKVIPDVLDNSANQRYYDAINRGTSFNATYWNKYIKPGDLIIYYRNDKKGNPQTHIAIAGNNPNEIYHDGSDINNVKQNSKDQAHYRRGEKKPYENFRIVRYTNQKNITQR